MPHINKKHICEKYPDSIYIHTNSECNKNGDTLYIATYEDSNDHETPLHAKMLKFYFKYHIKLLNISREPDPNMVQNAMLDLLKGTTLTKKEKKLLGV